MFPMSVLVCSAFYLGPLVRELVVGHGAGPLWIQDPVDHAEVIVPAVHAADHGVNQ